MAMASVASTIRLAARMSVIASNTVRGANGTGVIVLGRRILVESNDVAGSVMGDGVDADGIRFFGSDIIIRGNYIHDIYDRGYPPDEGPHTDCFQTFDDINRRRCRSPSRTTCAMMSITNA